MKHVPLIFVLLLASGGLSLIDAPENPGGGSPFSRLLWSSVYLIVCVLIYKRSQAVLEVVRIKPGFMFLAMLAVVSFCWSSDPARTLAHSMALFGATLLAYLVAATVEPRIFLRTAAFALGLLAVINFILALLQGGGSMAALGRFHGSFAHPNTLGRVSALTVLMCVALGQARIVPKVWWIIGIGASGFLLIASNSVTSLVALMLALGISWARSRIPGALSSGRLFVLGWMGVCIGGSIWLFKWEVANAVLGLLGRNPTLTGRTYLWQGVWNAVMEKPFLGYGYNGFWSGSGNVATRVYDQAGWTTMSAHNGLMEIALHVGVLGVAVFVIAVVPVIVRAFACDTEQGGGLPRIFLPILIYLLTLGLTESAYMNRNSIQWILLVSISIWIKTLHRTQDDGVLESSPSSEASREDSDSAQPQRLSA